MQVGGTLCGAVGAQQLEEVNEITKYEVTNFFGSLIRYFVISWFRLSYDAALRR